MEFDPLPEVLVVVEPVPEFEEDIDDIEPVDPVVILPEILLQPVKPANVPVEPFKLK